MERAPTWTPTAIIGQGVRRGGSHLYEVSTPAALLASLRAGDPVLQPEPDPSPVDPEEWSRVTFDALEDAGLPLERARTKLVGIFVGAVSQPSQLARHVSAELLLRGPTEGVEDSSLMAVYLACQALSDGACELALVLGGGEREQAVVLLARLDRAQAERQPVLAVIRATGPLPVQGPLSPTALKRVLVASSTDPADVGYVEVVGPLDGAAAHGALYGRQQSGPYFAHGRSDGVMALVRAVLSVRHREIFALPSPPLDGLGMRPVPKRTSWPLTRRAIVALTASNGRGSPVHAIVAQADPDLPPPSLADPPSVWMLPVSAYDAQALQLRAQDLVGRLGKLNLMDMAFTCCHHRSHLPLRAAIVAPDMTEARAALQALAAGAGHSHLVTGSRAPGKTAWLLSNAPESWAGAGAELWRDEPAFRDGFDEACRLLSSHGCQLRGEAFRGTSEGETTLALPASFALQVGLVAWLRSLGHEPDAIIGHETGEIVAGWACGGWTLSDAAALVAEHARGEAPSWRTRPRRAPAIPCWSAPTSGLREILQEAASLGVGTVLELGPDPAGTALAREVYGRVVQMLAPKVPELVSVRRAVAELYVRGAQLDWTRLVRVGTRVPLGAYPWPGRSRQARRPAPASGEDPDPAATIEVHLEQPSVFELLRHGVALGLWALPLVRPHRLQHAALALHAALPAGPLSMQARATGPLEVTVSVHAGALLAELALRYAPAEARGPFEALLPGSFVPMTLEAHALSAAQRLGSLQHLSLEVLHPLPAGEEVMLVQEQAEGACQIQLRSRHGLVGTAIFTFRSP
jgi:acyl transferase domain-containing protein